MKISTALYDESLTALLRGDRAKCVRIVRELLAGGVPIRSIYKDTRLGEAIRYPSQAPEIPKS